MLVFNFKLKIYKTIIVYKINYNLLKIKNGYIQ